MARFNQAAYQLDNQYESQFGSNTQLNSFAHLRYYQLSQRLIRRLIVLVQADNALVEALSSKQGWKFSSNNTFPQGNNLWKNELEQQLTNGQLAFVVQAD